MPNDFIMMLGSPGGAGMIPKKGEFSAIFNQTQMQRFAQTDRSNKYTKISMVILLLSGLELKIGRYLKTGEMSIDVRGLTYHIKKKRLGIGLHFTSYKHNLNTFYQGKSRETGISIHKRFKKKAIKPFLYYSRVLLYPRPDMIIPYGLKSEIEFLSFGVMAEINHFLLGTYITSQIEDTINLNKQSSQFNIVLGALLY